MRHYCLHWCTVERGREVLLRKEDMPAPDRASAERKALALFDDGGAVLGATRIKLFEDGAGEPFWVHP
jgi:hypothetical protein